MNLGCEYAKSSSDLISSIILNSFHDCIAWLAFAKSEKCRI